MGSFAEWTEKEKKKKKQKTAKGASFTEYTKQVLNRDDIEAPLSERKEEDIAPVRTLRKNTDGKKKDDGFDFFQKGALEDGYSFGDVTKTILGTGADLGVGVVKGASKLVGGVLDAGAYGVAGIADAFGADEFSNDLRAVARENVVDNLFKDTDEYLNKYSVLGRTSDSVAEGLGQVGAVILTGGVAAGAGLGAVGATAATTGAMGVSSLGSGMSEAYQMGATDEEAATYGLIKGVVDAGSELIFGGLGKAVKAVGLSKGLSSLDDVFAQKLANKITNHTAKNFVEYGVKASAEGVEEVLAGIGTAVGKKLTYMSEEELTELVKDENLMEQFVVGAVTSGVAQSGLVPGMKAGSLKESIETGRDFVSGLSQNEQKVIDKVYEDRIAEAEKDGKKLTKQDKSKLYDEVINEMEKGYISTDTIEEVLGGDTFKAYKDTIDSEDALKAELDELRQMKKGDMNDIQQDRLAELKAMNLEDTTKRDGLRKRLGEEVFGLVQSDRLAESYNERTRRGQAFEADLTKYDEKHKTVIQKAVESGILNNTNRTHEFVDMIAKISADKGVLFDFTNNTKLKESGFAVDGKTVNGYVTKDGITLNIDSAKSLNSVAGHEITHVLEGTELYEVLQKTVFEYAKSKGDYQGRYDTLSELYKGVEGADVNAELTADLVGDYLFTDSDFIKNLHTNNRNVFQKIYDEIKYLCKVATAGSKEARELEKVKRAFEKAYQEGGKATEDTKYSVSNGNDELFEQLTAKRKELQESDWLQDEIEDSDEYNALIKELVSSGASSEAIAKYKEWDARTGYSALVEKNKRLAKEARELAEQHDKSVREGWVADEAKAIAKSGLSEADYFRKKAVKEFGYTPYFYDAGYITTNGKMLNFSGEKGHHYGVRGQDHRAIGTIYADTEGTNALNRFVKDGNIRIMAESPGIDISAATEPTKEQYATIRKFASEYSDKGYFSIDLTGEDGRVVGSLTYQNRINPTRIVNDIKHYYATGEIRQQSDMDRLRYSLTDSEGVKLSKEQQEFFKDSKARDDDGNLKLVYHSTPTAGFTVFNGGEGQGNYKFGEYGGGVAFFTDSKDMADSYKPKDGGQYAGYLNLKNPLIVDAQNRHWNRVSQEFSQKVYDAYHSLTDAEKEALHDIAGWEELGLFRDEIRQAVKTVESGYGNEYTKNLASAYEKMKGNTDQFDWGGLFDAAYDNFTEESIKFNSKVALTTNDIVRKALEDGSYDGVIIKNVRDYGAHAYSNPSSPTGTDYIAFNSNQFKNADNLKPTENPDIRYSLSDSEGREISPAVQKRFSNSKVVDEDGNLKAVFHGTATGEFSIFDKSKGSVEGDFGSGFYFTDNEADVSEHYEGGGPDFDNKVARLAEQIESEEEIDYDEAEERAREQLYKGSHLFEVYLNIENPAIVGKTMLLDNESYMEQYNEEDYDDYDDYLGDVEQLVTYDIENVVWEVERNCDVNDTDGIAGVLWDAYAEGGIGLEDLKSRLNELYLEDSNGNLVANEVARQIIESLGYDGIIDPTVSGKWNMNIEEGTTHYIVFKPNQIKAVTNQNPTDNPDIHRSLSAKGEAPVKRGNYNVYGKDIALETAPAQEQEVVPTTEKVVPTTNATTDLFPDDLAPMSESIPGQFDSLTDADAPPEMEAPYYEDSEVTVDDPFENRDIDEVGNRKVKAYMYENPEVKPFFQAEAKVMLNELQNSVKGERLYNDELYYESGGEHGWMGTKRQTSDDIAYLLDERGYTYAEIEKGLKAIIEDDGKENNACSKRIEFILNDRLKDGYTDFLSGYDVPADQGYLSLLEEKQITEYSREALEALLASGDEYAPPISEEIAEDIAPVATERVETPSISEPYEAIRPKRKKEPRLARATPEEQAKIAEIMDEEPTPKNRRSRAWAKFKANVLDKGAVFEDLSLKNKNRELMGKWNYILSAESRAQRLMGNGASAIGVKSLNAIREEVGNTGKTKQFYEYLYHKHNVDRMSLAERYENTPNKPVFGNTVTAEVSQDIVSQYEVDHPEFEGFAEDVYNYMNYLRQQMVDNGVISQETADLWSEMYPHYVPIRRAGDEGLNINVPLDTGRTGVNAPIKRAKGGNRDILPLFDTMAMRTQQTYKAIAKNSFGVELKNTLRSTIANDATNLDEVIDSIDMQDGLLQEGKDGGKPTFTVFENGEKVTFEITEDMYDALKPVSGGMALTIKPLNVASNIHRGLLTEYNPVFMLNNMVKDAQDILINSQHARKTYAKVPEAFAQLVSKGYWYNEYMDNGGEQNTYFDNQTNTFKTENKGLSKALDMPPFSTISALNNFIEMTPRLAEYIASREAGRSVEVSMLDAARVTTNFQAGGDLTKFLNRNGATFLNASVQGAMQNIRNFREAHANGVKGYINLATKFAIAGLPAILLNNLVWDDDEEYEELSDYVKQNYYVVGKYDDGKFIRIPKGRTLAVIQNAFEQVSNAATGDDELDLATFLELVVSNLAPNNPIENNILAPIVQVAKNETWYGEDLVPTRLADLPAAEQFDESTDSISRWLGEKLDISPVKINYLLDQYSGGVGDVVLPMLTPEAESGDNSLIGNVLAPLKKKFTTDSVMNNQNVSDFYDTKDELATNAKMSVATDEDKLMSKYMNSINSELSELYKQKREIQNGTLPDDEKYEAVREIQSQIVDLTRESLNTYEDVSYHTEKDGEYANIGDRYFKLDDDGEWQKLSDEQVTKYKVTSAAGDSLYATDGTNHYRWYEPGEDAGEDAKPGWRKVTDKELERQEEVTNGLNISPEEYWGNKEEYGYAYDYPESYAVAKAVGGYEAYRSYSSELYDIKADKDSSGKSISGSRKEKVLDYVNGLDIDYGEKIILFKSEYNADDTYNYDIIEYLNGRDDISYEEMETILKKLGFTVSANGDISW